MDKATIIKNLKEEFPELKNGSEETGYTEFTPAQYEETISQWADNLLAKAELEEQEAKEVAKLLAEKTAAQQKLAALGLTTDDLKALGL